MVMPREDEYKPSVLRDIETWNTNKSYRAGDEVLYDGLIMVSMINDNEYIPVWPGNPFWKLKIIGIKGGK